MRRGGAGGFSSTLNPTQPYNTPANPTEPLLNPTRGEGGGKGATCRIHPLISGCVVYGETVRLTMLEMKQLPRILRPDPGPSQTLSPDDSLSPEP